MIYIKSMLVGFAVAAVTMIAWFFGEMVLAAYIVIPQIQMRSIAETGSGGIGAVSTVSYGPFLGMAAFALGFSFMLRRLKLRRMSK